MSFLNIVKSRYSTKKYDPSRKISEKEISELKIILHLSPSSINSQPWRFTFISDEKVKNELAKVSYFNESKIQEASHLVIFSVIDNVELFEKQLEENNSKGAIEYYNRFLRTKSKDEIKDWLSRQVYVSLGFFLSACATMKIDSTPMEGIISEDYDSILKLESYKTLVAVAIGYRDSDDLNHPDKKPKSRLKIEEVIRSI